METLVGSNGVRTGRMPVLLVILLASLDALAGTLVNLDADSPYYPGRSYPKLITPQWVGEEGVEAVVILAIDDMRDQPRYEKFLRPILDRLKKVAGRAPVSIMTCKIEPGMNALQDWIKEGLNFEVHTVEHPCPILAGGDFVKGKSTYDRCLDQIAAIANNRAVAFRTPCCDSLNTPSPRLFAEIFNKTSPGGHFLSIDSSVFNITSANHPELPRELVLEKDGRERFRKYVPFESFVNTIDDYPYPYIIGRLCWEFPCATPSDWQAQFVHKRNASPVTLADWKALLDVTVIKKGVMTMVFHPYGWSAPEQWVELIDYAQGKYGKNVKFLNFREAEERLTKNLLGGTGLRGKDGGDNGVRMMDLNGDGFLDVALAGKEEARVWNPKDGKWEAGAYPENLKKAQALLGAGTGYLRDLNHDGRAELIVGEKVYGWEGGEWKAMGFGLPAGMTIESGVTFVDVNEDGFDDLVFSNAERSAFYLFDGAYRAENVGEAHPTGKGWTRKVFDDKRGRGKNDLPMIVRADGTNNGLWVHSRTLWWQNENTDKLKNLVDRRTLNELLAGQQPTARSPKASLASIKVAPGYQVELVASEPLVADPIAFAFGPDGKLWVVEMGDYPLGVDGKGKVGGRVKYLEDLDGDGVYDKVTVFLSDVPYPTSVLPWKKGVLVAAAPDIFYAEDTDGDGKADKREILFSGFKEGNQQHRLNHLSFGLDNWVYGANGDSGGNVKSIKTGQTASISGRDFRFKPDTGEFEAVSGGSQFARSRTDGGDWFGNNNSNPLWHYPLEEVHLKRNPHVAPPPGTLRVDVPEIAGASPVFAISPFQARYNDLHTANHFTSACAAHVYRDDLFSVPAAPMQMAESAEGEWSVILVKDKTPKVIKASAHVMAIDDRVAVTIKEIDGPEAESTQRYQVASDGKLHLPYAGGVPVAGKTGDQVVTAIWEGYSAANINIFPAILTLKLHPPRSSDVLAKGCGEWRVSIGEKAPVETVEKSDHFLAAGDVVLVTMLEVEGPGVESIRRQAVSVNGTVTLPLIGRVNVAGKRGEIALAEIRDAYRATKAPINSIFTLALNPPLDPAQSERFQIFISEPVHNLIHREIVTGVGSTFAGHRAPGEEAAEFLASSDNWFRPTTVETGPDGALYIADMYRQTIEHPQWIPKDAQDRLDLRLGHDMGRIYRVSPVGTKRRAIPRLDKLDTAGLVAALDSSNGWQRDMAQAMLVWRGDKGAVALLEKMEGRSALGRLHTLCTLDGLGTLKIETIAAGLKDQDETVRRHAVRLCEGRMGELADQTVLNPLATESARVRLQLAYTLGSSDEPVAAIMLGKLLTDSTSDRFVIAAALSSLNAKNIGGVAAAITEAAKQNPPAPEVLAGVLRTAVGTNQAKAIGDTLATLTEAKGGKYEAWQYRTLANLLDSLDESNTNLAKLGKDDATTSSITKAVDNVLVASRALAGDASAPLELRAAAIRLFLRRFSGTSANDLKIIDPLLSPQSPRELQAAIISGASRRGGGGSDVAGIVLLQWKSLTPDLRAAATEALLARPERAKLLLDQIEAKKVLVMEIDAPRRQRMLQYPDKTVRTRAAELFAQTINADRQKVIDGFAAALTLNGDAKNGSAIFGKTCAICHRLGEVGNAVGPDLMSVGDKSPQGLLIAILDPNRAVEPRYINYIVTTNDDQSLTGLLASETATSITLIGPDAKPITLRRTDLKDLRSSNTSLMPDGLEAGLKAQDLADLIAFVRAGK